MYCILYKTHFWNFNSSVGNHASFTVDSKEKSE